MKNKNLKLLIATSLVTGAISLSTTAKASDDLTPKKWQKNAMSGKSSDETKHVEKKCGEKGCGEGSCG